MKPTASHLIEAARMALEEHIAPDVKSELAGSAVRSINMVLKHLAVRCEREGGILWEEHQALKRLLLQCAETLKNLDQAPNARMSGRITAALANSRVAAEDYPSIELLDEENAEWRGLVDDVLTGLLHELSENPDQPALQDLRGSIRQHLDEQILRERVLYFPVFTGPPV